MTTTSDNTETAHIGPGLHAVPAAPTGLVPETLAAWARSLRYSLVADDDYAELVAAGRDAIALLQAANAEASRLRHALTEIAERSHGVRSFVLDPTIERVIDGGGR